jgi:hypothetical protein
VKVNVASITSAKIASLIATAQLSAAERHEPRTHHQSTLEHRQTRRIAADERLQNRSEFQTFDSTSIVVGV